ncbi:MAG: LysR family transcriptional regulator [Candidatus Berkiella sp.]
MNKLECIITFIKVIEENGFASAARALKVSTAAVSRQISALENHLGVSLLKRTTRKISLTEQGQLYFTECKEALAGLANAEALLTSSTAEARGQLSILSSPHFAEKYLLPKLETFMQSHPLLTIKLDLSERFPDFDKENIDIAFGISMEGPSELVRRQVASTRYVLCVAPSYVAKHGIPKTPKDLIKHPYITHSMRQPDDMILLEGNHPIFVRPILWLNDTHAMCESAILGLGMVRLHDYVVNDALAKGDLVEILPDFHQQTVPVYLYYQKNRFLQPKIRKCIDYFTAT